MEDTCLKLRKGLKDLFYKISSKILGRLEDKKLFDKFCQCLQQNELVAISSKRTIEVSDAQLVLEAVFAGLDYYGTDINGLEIAYLKFLASLSKSSPDLIPLSTTLRKEWHSLAVSHHNAPSMFLKNEMSRQEEVEILKAIMLPVFVAEDDAGTSTCSDSSWIIQDQHQKQMPAECFSSHQQEIMEIMLKQDTVIVNNFVAMLTAVGLISTAEKDQIQKLESPLIKSKTLVSTVHKVIQRGTKPENHLGRFLAVISSGEFQSLFTDLIINFKNEAPHQTYFQDFEVSLKKSSSNTIKVTKESASNERDYAGNRNPLIASFRHHLKSRYKVLEPERFVMEDDEWKFFDLTADQELGSTPETIITKLDYIFRLQRIPILFEFPRLLIIGDSGMGKSTLAIELCRKWSDDLIFQDYDCVILLQGSDLKVQQFADISLLDHDNKKCIESIEKNKGAGVLIIVEGYDELLPNEGTDNRLYLVDRILQNITLNAASLIVTARPWCSKKLKKFFPDLQPLQILGFTISSREDFIEHHAQGNKKMKEEILMLLKKFPLEGCAFVPFYIAIICAAYRASKEDFSKQMQVPRTRTEMYGVLIGSLVHKFLLDSDVPNPFKMDIGMFIQLPRDIYSEFLKLCVDSYEAMMKDGLISNPRPTKFGLLFKHRPLLNPLSSEIEYKFIHSSIAEYLAAYAISRKTPEEVKKFFIHLQDQALVGRFSLFLEFLSGFVCIDDYNVYKIEPDTQINSLSLFSQICETKKIDSCIKKAFEDVIDKQVTVCRTWPLPTYRDFWCLGKVIALSGKVTWVFGFTLRQLNDEHLKMFVEGIKSYQQSHIIESKISKLSIGLNHLQGVQDLLEISCFSNCLESIQHLNLMGNHFGSDMIELLSKGLHRLPNLQVLLVHNNKISPGAHIPLIKALRSFESLKQISFSCLQEDECKLLLKVKSLKILEFWQLKTKSVKAMFGEILLSNQKTLDKLEIRQSTIDINAVEILSKALKESQITKLVLSNCGIDSEIAKKICKAAQNLLLLDLTNNIIDDEAGKELLKLDEQVDLFKTHECNYFTDQIVKEFECRRDQQINDGKLSHIK